MDSSTVTNGSSRRPEDIALDLLKFVASHANIKSGSTGNTPGFGIQSTTRGDDAETQLLDLYTRCRQAVEASVPAR